VRKTSVYLDDIDVARLRRVAEREHLSQAQVIRAALAAYEARQTQSDRDFELAAVWSGDGSSVADSGEEELLAGFGS
jgi:predicted transcriptional regulator